MNRIFFFTNVDKCGFNEMNGFDPWHWLGSGSHKGSMDEQGEMEYGEELMPCV